MRECRRAEKSPRAGAGLSGDTGIAMDYIMLQRGSSTNEEHGGAAQLRFQRDRP